jgi:hypothetical protein
LRPSEYSVLLLDPYRYRLRSSSFGIGCPFRVLGPRKYRHYCFCDPAVPLALAPAVRSSFHELPPKTFKSPAASSRRVCLPLESHPTTPTRPPQRSGPLMGFCSLQHFKDPRSTCRGLKPARYVPSSGFGYPLDGLLPRIPCRFCFAPAALLGFTLRRFPLPRGLPAFPLR